MASDTNLRPSDLPLVEYRIYALDQRDRIFSPAEIIEAVNDDEVVKKAARILDGRTIEVWGGARLIARLKPDGLPCKASM